MFILGADEINSSNQLGNAVFYLKSAYSFQEIKRFRFLIEEKLDRARAIILARSS